MYRNGPGPQLNAATRYRKKIRNWTVLPFGHIFKHLLKPPDESSVDTPSSLLQKQKHGKCEVPSPESKNPRTCHTENIQGPEASRISRYPTAPSADFTTPGAVSNHGDGGCLVDILGVRL